MRTLRLTLVLVAAGGLLIAGCAEVRKAATQYAVDEGRITADQAASINRAGDAIERTFEDITPEQEHYIGRAVAASLLARYQPLDDLEANAYVNELGQTLALLGPRPETFAGYHFLLLDSDEINAFACPGGLILVTRGLVRCCPDEDALAAVLAHEIGHVAGKHGLRAVKKGRLVEALAILGTESARQLGSEDVQELAGIFENSVQDIVETLVNNGYARGLEAEADGTAVEVLAGSGYDPHGLEVMLTTMDARWTAGGPGFLHTHPAPRDRLADVRPQLAGADAPAPAPAVRAARFQAALGGVI